MVRLKNPMSGMADAGDAPPHPAVDGHDALLRRLDEGLRDHVRAALADVRGRILIVGSAWPELALEQAEAGRFVTMIDPRNERLVALRSIVLDRGLTQRLTLDARSYAEVSYEAATFEAIVLYEPFPYLASPAALLAKCRREMRAGGQLLMRVVVSSGASFPDGRPSHGLMAEGLDVPALEPGRARVVAARTRVLQGVWSVLAGLRLLDGDARGRDPGRRGPSWEALSTALSEHFVVTDVRALQFASFEVAELACSLRPPLGRAVSALVGVAQRLDERLLAHPGLLRALAPALLVHATKQRELGRVFVLPKR